MKRKFVSGLAILFLAVTILVPIGANPDNAEAASTFKIRTSMPTLSEEGSEFYYSKKNLYYAAGRLAPDFKRYSGIMDDGKTAGYVWGNCTWYAYARGSEILNAPMNKNFSRSASKWWDINQSGKYYPSGSTPKAGAIVCYKTHVAVVEKVVNGQPYVSESGWQTRTYGPSSTHDFFFHYGKPWSSNGTPKGYIYLTNKSSSAEKTISANYSVKVSVSDLRMRSGPGTGYSNMGYIKKGVHQLKATNASKTWGQLKSNGYWISLDYAKKVVSKSSNNQLKALSVTGHSISPSFKSATTSYTCNVPSNVSSVTIKATKAHAKATISGTGKVSLSQGDNTKKVKVKAENGTSKTYTLKINRSKETKVKVTVSDLNMRSGPGSNYASKGKIKKGTYAITQKVNGWGKLKTNGYWISLSHVAGSAQKSTNNKLKALSISGYTISPKFKAATTSYTCSVPSNVSAVTIKATKAHSKAKISGTGKVNLSQGSNTKKVKVTAENGKQKTYTLKINRSKETKVKVTISDLNMRSGPGSSYASKGKIKKGTYAITQKVNGWGKLKTNGYWIKLSYTTPVKDSEYKVKVSISDLNMRSGPGSSYASKGKIKKGTYVISKTSNGWGKVKTNGYWIKLSYTTRVT